MYFERKCIIRVFIVKGIFIHGEWKFENFVYPDEWQY